MNAPAFRRPAPHISDREEWLLISDDDGCCHSCASRSALERYIVDHVEHTWWDRVLYLCLGEGIGRDETEDFEHLWLVETAEDRECSRADRLHQERMERV